MQHEKLDFEISELMKEASAKVREKSFTEAILLVKEGLDKTKDSSLLYSHASYTKVIPYFQKAGRYSEAEPFCVDILIPLIRVAIKKGMNQRCAETQEVHFFQYIAKLYDKLKLIAKREGKAQDKERFTKEYNFYQNKWNELQTKASQIELENEYQEVLALFGSDTSEWPRVIRRQFQSLIANT